MPTTSNFGWTTPADTDLVKDGALAIRTLGNGIDTSMAELKGGTTGQILSKTSNTDMDFTWINNDQGDITAVSVNSPLTGGGTSGAVTIGIQDGTTTQKGAVQLENSVSSTSTTTAAVPAGVKTAYDLAGAAIPKSTVTTNGDLIYGTGSSTVTRLGIGSTNQVLTVSGGVPTWATPAASGGDLVRITTNNFSAATGVVLSSVFSSTYDNYLVVGRAIQTGSNAIRLRLRSGSTDYTTADQKFGVIYNAWDNAVVAGGGSSETSVFNFSPATTQCSWQCWILSPNLTVRTQAAGFRVDENLWLSFGYSAGNTTSYDSLNLTVSGGTFTGEISVYGLKRS